MLKKLLILLCFLILIAGSGCTDGTTTDANTSSGQGEDLFPDKANIEYARYFDVEYHNNYKTVTVSEPGTNVSYSYILVQKGTPAPEIAEGDMLIEVPVDSLVALSTTHLPGLEIIGEQQKLKAISNFDYVNSPKVREMIENGQLEQVKTGEDLNTEMIISLNPDIVMTTTVGDGAYDDHISHLRNMGLSPVINIEYKEETPLGQTEWIKFISLFFNKEKEANEYFDTVAGNYEQLAANVSNVDARPEVMAGMSWKGTWYVPGGKSLISTYIEDAGGSYVWDDDDHTSTIILDFETVFNQSSDTDYWITTQIFNDMNDVQNKDPLLMELNPARQETIYTNCARVSEMGGNDYYESGIVHPDLILADLVSIFQPQVLPDHEPVYYKHVGNTSGEE